MNDTTRKYPRTLLEAFPRDAQHAYAIEHTKPPMGVLEAVIAWASITGMCVLIAWAVVA